VEEVPAEYLTFCSASRPSVRSEAVRTVRNVLNAPHTTVIPQSHASFLDALAFYASRLDKHYSLTDCVAMQAMRREGLMDVLSNDHHFTQEGFHILFT
jgi:predicted nucleic acid-binding protein